MEKYKNRLNIILGILSIGAVYLYAVTIWTDWGYDSYFGIPASFVSYSIRENSIFSYVMFQAILLLLISIKWYGWILIIIITGIILYFFSGTGKLKWGSFILLAVFLTLFLLNTVKLGENIAKSKIGFFTFDSECTAMGTSTKYLIPDFYDGKALLVPYTKIENGNNKMIGGFIVKDLSETPCKVIYDSKFGKIEP